MNLFHRPPARQSAYEQPAANGICCRLSIGAAQMPDRIEDSHGPALRFNLPLVPVR